jgi:hypothetical protein
MWHEPRDVVPGLGQHLRAERLLLGVRRTGEEEVLPHQKPALVALCVEVVRLVDASAPHPDEVDPRFPGLTEPLGVPLACDAVRKGVVRNPVDALGEDRLTVDHELERSPLLVWLRVEDNGAETDP